MARTAIDRLPEHFAASLREIVFQVEEFADNALLSRMGIANPFHLLGIYEGVPLTMRSIEQSGTLPERIRLFRQPILAAWHARGNETIERMVAHVTIHEIGHHFGLSDEDMHALEDEA